MTIRERVDTAAVEELPKIAAEIAEAEAALRLRLNTATATAETMNEVTVSELAAQISVHPKTVYKWTTRTTDPLPTVGQGRNKRISVPEFKAWRRRQSEER